MQLTARVLGQVQITADGRPIDLGGSRQRRLLAALLVHRGSVVSTDELVEVMFDGNPPEAAWRTFRTYVARLRRALDFAGADGSSVVVTVPSGYATAIDLESDAAQFEDLLAAARGQLGAGDPNGALASVQAALALWTGPAYGEFAAEGWACPEAVRLDELRLVAREVHAAAMVESGRQDEAIAEIRALVESQPLREAPRRLLMLALYRSGRHAEALRAGRDYRRLLVEQTGLEWGKDLAELEQMVIDRDPRLDARASGHEIRGYVLSEVIAESPHGITYRASQPSVSRDVALTVIRAEFADDAVFIRQFDTYAQRIATIEHPNVVPLYDYWREPGAAYVVTRFLAGGSLASRLDRGAAFTGPDVARIVIEVGDALRAAHDRVVAHGRLTATSVLFDAADRAYLTGFLVDADPGHASARGDTASLADLAEVLWRHASLRVGAIGDADHAAGEVAGVLAHARAEGFAFTDEFAESFAAATRGDLGAAFADSESARDRPEIEGPNPYRGLQPFRETDGDVFFGRWALVDQLSSDLRRDGIVVLIGPSGSGKSSVVRAGLVDQMRRAGTFVATMVPGTHPLDELEIALSRVAARPVGDLQHVLGDATGLGRVVRDALPDPDARLVVFVDQLEEAVTMSDPFERDLVFGALARAFHDIDCPIQVVSTLRADFLGRILEHGAIGRLVRDHSRFVTVLEADELYEAIVEPAASAGVVVEPELAAALVADAVDAPGSLPLLEFALTELYERRSDGTMTMDAYRQMGGLATPIAHRAEEVYATLSEDEQEAARRLFARLITLGEGSADTRRRVLRSELATVPQSVLDAFGSARLLTFDRDPRTREPTVEIAHEALIGRWPRLSSWVDDDRGGLMALRHLTISSAAWAESDRDPAELYRGRRLAAVEEWASHRAGDLTPVESEFLDASRRERDLDAERQRRRASRLRSITVGLGVVAALALIAGAIAVVQRDRAEDNRRLAETKTVEADVQRLVTEAGSVLDEDPDLAILLALEAYDRSALLDTDPPGQAVATLQTAVQSSRVLRRFRDGSGAAALSPDGRTIVLSSADDERTAIVIDAATGEEIRRFDSGGEIGTMSYDPSGGLLAIAYFDPEEFLPSARAPSRLFETTSYTEVERLADSCCPRQLRFSPDGRYLAASGYDSDDVFAESLVLVWDLREPRRPPAVHRETAFVGWMPDSETVVVTTGEADDADEAVRFLDSRTGEDQRPPLAITDIESVDVSADGERLLVVGETVRVVEMTGERSTIQFGDSDSFPGAYNGRFTPDGTRAVIFGGSDEIWLIDLDTHEVEPLRGNRGTDINLAIDRDGSTMVAAGSVGGTVLWDLGPSGPAELRNLPTSGTIETLSFSSDGADVIVTESSSENRYRVRTFDVVSGHETFAGPEFDAASAGMRTSQTGLIAYVGVDGAGRVERFADRSLLANFDECERPVAMRADGGMLLLSGQFRDECLSRSSRIIDPVSGEELLDFDGRNVVWADFGPSGTISEDFMVALTLSYAEGVEQLALEFWRVSTGERIASEPDGDHHFWLNRFSSDGRYFGVGSGRTGGYAFDVERLLGGVEMKDAIVLNPTGDGGATLTPEIGDGWMVVGQSDQVLRFSDLETGIETMSVSVELGEDGTYRLTPDGRYLYYATSDGVIRRFPLDHAELAELARMRVQRDFFREECERFSIADDCSVYEPVAST